MIKGLEIFREAFREYSDRSYLILEERIPLDLIRVQNNKTNP